MDTTLFIVFIFLLQLACFFVGSSSSQSMKTQDEYFLAGKSIRFFPLMMTFLATQVGGGLVLGAADEAYQFGWTVLLLPLGSTLGLILLGFGVGRKLLELKVATVAQIFETVYGSKALKKFASILSIVSLFMIFVAQIIASKKFMASLEVQNGLWFFLFWGLVILYTAMGGLKAVVSTDIVQAAFFVAAFLICAGYVIFYENITILPQEIGEISESINQVSTKFCGWLFMPLLFMVIEQDMGQRCFAAASPKVISRATLVAALCTFGICVIPVFLGVIAKSSNILVDADSSVLMTTVQHFTTPAISALVGAAVLAAIISTADSLLNAIGSNLAQDFNLSFLKTGEGKGASSVRIAQGLTCLIAIAGMCVSFSFTGVVDLLIISYELSVSCLFIPIIFALFKKQSNAFSAVLAIVFGAIGFVLFRAYLLPLPKEVTSVFLSLFGFFLGEIYIKFFASKNVEDIVYEQ